MLIVTVTKSLTRLCNHSRSCTISNLWLAAGYVIYRYNTEIREGLLPQVYTVGC